MPPLRRPAAIGLAVAIGAAACATPSAQSSPTGSTPTAVAPSTSAAPSSAPASGSAAPSARGSSGEPPSLALEPVADGFVSPIGIATAPDGWLLVQQQAGLVFAIRPQTGERAIVADFSDRIRAGGEQGLLGLALHPDWPEDRRAFVHYTATDGDAVVAEVGGSQAPEGWPVLDPSTERILIELPDPFPNHNGGQLAFGPDGFLWIGLGDGGSADDPLGNGQNPSELLGSILRIDVAEAGRYAIPADNPFADGSNGAPEVYLYGLRNPWRFSFDPQTDLLWIADVGQNAYEEIDRLDPAASAGANLGWNRTEGAHCFRAESCETTGLVPPLAEYGRDLGCSVTGGHVYRGSAVADLDGWYLFSDYCTGLLFGLPPDAEAPGDGTALAPRVLAETGASVSSFGVDTDGELYLADLRAGVVSRIVAAGG